MASEKTLKEWRVFWEGGRFPSHSKERGLPLHLDGGGSGGWPHKVRDKVKKGEGGGHQLITV